MPSVVVSLPSKGREDAVARNSGLVDAAGFIDVVGERDRTVVRILDDNRLAATRCAIFLIYRCNSGSEIYYYLYP